MTKIIILILLSTLISGCIGVDYQGEMTSHSWSWKTFSFSKHDKVFTDSPIRWYQYDINGKRKPYGFKGFIYTLSHPEWWFWYGPENMNKYRYYCHFKKGCPECGKYKISIYELDKYWRSDRLKENDNYNFNIHNKYMLDTYGATNVLIEPED